LLSDKIKNAGATHVVTGITYGEMMMGNVTETNSGKLSGSHIDGELSLKICRSFGALILPEQKGTGS